MLGGVLRCASAEQPAWTPRTHAGRGSSSATSSAEAASSAGKRAHQGDAAALGRQRHQII